MPGDDDVSQPLLPNSSSPPASPSRYAEGRRRARDVLASKRKHYLIMGLVALDVIAVLGDVFIALVACDMGEGSEEWVGEWREGLKLAGLVFSSLFLLELLICVWAFGLGFFGTWFHIFDAVVIIVSFTFDLLAHGILEEIGSLVIILRLWRFVKIIDELSVGASERMEEIEAQVEQLEKENADLKSRVEALKRQEEQQDQGTA